MLLHHFYLIILTMWIPPPWPHDIFCSVRTKVLWKIWWQFSQGHFALNAPIICCSDWLTLFPPSAINSTAQPKHHGNISIALWWRVCVHDSPWASRVSVCQCFRTVALKSFQGLQRHLVWSQFIAATWFNLGTASSSVAEWFYSETLGFCIWLSSVW